MNQQAKQNCTADTCNHGIRCEVKNCEYHSANDCCEAKTIHVGPQFAVSSQDTVCATFRCKDCK